MTEAKTNGKWRRRVALFVFLLTWLSPVDFSDSDAAMMLVAAQGWIEHGALGFDPYATAGSLEYPVGRYENYRVRQWPWGTGYYSLGAPIVAAPTVWVANRLGLDMVEKTDEANWQNFLSALSCSAVFLLSHALARAFLGPKAAIGLAAGVVLGSSLVSSLGTALWTNHFAVLTALIVLLTLVRFAQRPLGLWRWAGLGLLVLVATACRPGSAFLGILLGLAFVLRARQGFRWVLVVSLLVVVIGTSRWWLPLLPFYYSPTRIPLVPKLEGLVGVLLSPSRGLFVFSPILLLVLPAGWRAVRSSSKYQVLSIAIAAWVVVHSWFVAAMPMWWGGHSYGPRLLVDLIPGFLVLIAVGWSLADRQNQAKSLARLAMVLALPSILIHSGSGLFNTSIREWNQVPNIDRHRELLWSWRYPQFMASPTALRSRIVEHQAARIITYEIGREVELDSTNAVFDNWYRQEDRWRWSRGTSAAVMLRLGSVVPGSRYQMVIEALSLDPQAVEVELGGSTLGTIELSEVVTKHILELRPGGLPSNSVVSIRFHASTARPTAQDERQLGLALFSLRIEDAEP